MLVLSGCKNNADEASAQQKQQQSIDSMKIAMQKQQAEMAKQKTIDSMNSVAAAHAQRAQQVAASNAAAPAKKKGWSGTAKGAVIGAGAGAIGGALIDKKHGEGAVVGGLAGAALGAGTGAIVDSKKKK